MNIPRYWARAHDGRWFGVGWSFCSQAEAEANAAHSLAEVARRFHAGELHHGAGQYYTDRPVREPIVREFTAPNGKPSAFVTRNLYGSYVLNAAAALFVDVDFPDEQKTRAAEKTGPGFFKRLFGGGAKNPPPSPGPRTQTPEETTCATAEAWAANRAGWGWRIYRTRAGLRLLATHALFSPGDAIVEAAFDALGSDPLYRKLCHAQRCFRARLTPKPWRCGSRAANLRWPWRDDAAKRAFDEWDSGYTEACKTWATCRLVGTVGVAAIHPELEPIVRFHDAVTRCESTDALA